jgi:hypothetical protein
MRASSFLNVVDFDLKVDENFDKQVERIYIEEFYNLK